MTLGKEIFEEMCRRIGKEPSDINFFKEDWYENNKWTVEEALEFKDWMCEYLENNPEAIEDLNKLEIKGKNTEELARLFVAFFGWDYYEE